MTITDYINNKVDVFHCMMIHHKIQIREICDKVFTIFTKSYNAVRAYFGGTKFHQTQNKMSSLWNYKKLYALKEKS